MDNEYDITKLVDVKSPPWWVKWYYRFCVPFMIPIIFFRESMRTIDKNVLHDGKRKLTGIKKIALSGNHKFSDVKTASRALKVTINELLTAALAVAIK